MFPHLGAGRSEVFGQGSLAADAVEGRPAECGNQELDYLRQPELRFTKTIRYTRRCIKPVHGEVDRDAVTNITDPLITGMATLDLTADCSAIKLPRCEPLTLHVPPAYPKQQYGHLLFGVASRYERIQASLPVFAHWLAGTGAHLVVVAADADQPYNSHLNLTALEEAYCEAGIQASIIPPSLKTGLPRNGSEHLPKDDGRPAPVEQLHFMLIRDMLEAATEETQWLGVLDDDTFFPALYPLGRELARHDHTRPAWLGALADNFFSVRIWGFMAYGGAGVFLSVPLARQLEPRLEECITTTSVPGGDGMLRDCVYAHTTTKLTLVDGLYQHDFRGDASGFFESGRRVLSLHHWKSWYRAPVAAMASITRVCGDCFLQRFRFGRDTLLANGYSITQYSPAARLDSIDLSRVEGTWQYADDDKFDFVYGPFREALGPEAKKSWRLMSTVEGPRDGGQDGAGGGAMRQVYVYRARRDLEENPVDEVIELVWES
ncbi:hypothetical protein MMYC01_204181 [Madurella mycetomatis]|uniref:Glycosyltransferase family 31 protein n=1 Tax=Madurella mycetomatis TaxID=100816 RepID=A0A175W646_9PEZI|nr:hypothetical protein MMYC01_204181 [Madurella mycetomatis]